MAPVQASCPIHARAPYVLGAQTIMNLALTLFALAFVAGSPAVGAQTQTQPEPWCFPGHHQAMAFPLQAKIQHPTLAAHCFVPTVADRARVQSLQNYRCVRLQGGWRSQAAAWSTSS